TFQERSGRGFVPYGSQGSSLFGLSFFFGSSTYGGGRQYSGRAPAPGGGDVIPGMVADASPIPKIIHPSQIIHEHILREAPQAKIVITHDDDWRDVFRDDGARPTGQASGEWQRAIFDRFEIMEEDGAVFLATKSHTSASMDNAAMTEEQCQDHGRITMEEPSDNLRVPEHMSADQDHGDSREGLLDPNFTENQPDPHDSAYVSDGTVYKEQGGVGEGSQAWMASSPQLPPYRSPQASLLAGGADLPVSPILMPRQHLTAVHPRTTNPPGSGLHMHCRGVRHVYGELQCERRGDPQRAVPASTPSCHKGFSAQDQYDRHEGLDKLTMVCGYSEGSRKGEKPELLGH
ncbi:hypothetical protein DFH08DRAFT_993395, partial [Mycena albidolilacea]